MEQKKGSGKKSIFLKNQIELHGPQSYVVRSLVFGWSLVKIANALVDSFVSY